MSLTGRVIEEQKNYFVVDTPDGAVITTTSGSLKKTRQRVCTGDIVDLLIISDTPRRGVISAIHKRTSYIRRPALANCSRLLCIATSTEPPLNLECLDRLLVMAHIWGVRPCIIFNKEDVLTGNEHSEQEKIISVYRSIGYPVFSVSSKNGNGIEQVTDYCRNETSACAGLSGVGKSTLLSAIFPQKTFRIGGLSESANRGTHTTTNVTLLPLPHGGYIADTPGIAFIDLPVVPEENIVLYFPEITSCIGECRFNNCIHDSEPGCIVTERVHDGAIAEWRHTHYLKFYSWMREQRKRYRK
jgi:ribosome biogenesis GTPase / thiamine phosphate phosphatase